RRRLGRTHDARSLPVAGPLLSQVSAGCGECPLPPRTVVRSGRAIRGGIRRTHARLPGPGLRHQLDSRQSHEGCDSMKAHTLSVRNLRTLGCALALVAATFALPGCSSVKGGGGATSGGGGTGTGGNSVAIAVGSGPAMNSGNLPLTSVTICVPGTSNCQKITDVLVDT